ncbi:MAG: hypothetical protein P1V97_04965 [Planctomycetota bacterium]|nr:hypothetical protein [Planctomycetota bacterium]
MDSEDQFLKARFQSFSQRLGRDFRKLPRQRSVARIWEFCKESVIHEEGSYAALVAELLAMPLQQFLRASLTTIHLRVSKDQIEIQDDGDGLLLNKWNPRRGINLVEEQLCHFPEIDRLMSGPRVHLDPNFGFGPLIINALSRSLTVQSCRDGKLWEQRFMRGRPECEPYSLGRTKSRGSLITLVPDPDFFEGLAFPHRDIRRLIFSAAHLFPALKLTLNGEEYQSQFGLGDLCQVIEPLKSFQRPFFEFSEESEALIVMAAAMGVSRRSEERCWLNGAAVAEGAVQDGLRSALKERGWIPSLALIHVISKSPKFDAMDEREAKNPMLGEMIREMLSPALRDFAFKDS